MMTHYGIFVTGNSIERLKEIFNGFENIEERIHSRIVTGLIHRIVVELTEEEVVMLIITLDNAEYAVYRIVTEDFG